MREKECKKDETARNGIELAYTSSHFARFHSKCNQRNLRNAKIRDIVITKRRRVRNENIFFQERRDLLLTYVLMLWIHDENQDEL